MQKQVDIQQEISGRKYSWYEKIKAEDGIRDFCLSRGLGDVYKRQSHNRKTLEPSRGAWKDGALDGLLGIHASAAPL